MILFKVLDDGCVHIPELTAVALVKDNDNTLIKNRMTLVPVHKVRQLLDRCDDDFVLMGIAFFVPILQLTLQHPCGGVAVGGALLKAVIFLPGLIVQILAVNHEENLINIW